MSRKRPFRIRDFVGAHLGLRGMYASPKAKRLKSALTRGIAAGLWTVILSPFAIASLTTDYEHIVWGTLLLAIAVSSLAALFSVRRDRAGVWASEGRCRTCGYNLRGNESGVCPECSTPVPRHDAGATFRNPLGFRRIAKWACLVVCLLILIVWHHSLDTYVTWTSPEKQYQCILTSGRIELIAVVPGGQLSFADCISPGFQSETTFYVAGPSFGLFNPFVKRTFDYSALWLPLWIPFLVSIVPTAFLWLFDVPGNEPPSGRGRTCSHKLTRNGSGKCPECSTPVPAQETTE